MNEEWRGLQDGSVVFGVSGPADFAEMESFRYARTYVDEGEVTLQKKKGRKWVRVATMSRSSRDAGAWRAGGAGVSWQTIESAPMDGTEVDLWCLRSWLPPETHERYVNAHWDEYGKCWRGPQLHYVARIYPPNDARDRHLIPTHWMPIPTPPA